MSNPFLDEAYLDVTDNLKGISSATRIANEIRARIRAETGLTASAGVSYNKFLAKLASDQNKPDGLFVITPAEGPGFVKKLPVGRFHGVGPATEAKMNRLGIVTGADLERQSLTFLQQHFGKAGPHFYAIARGADDRPVRPDRVRKSVGAENTFAGDLSVFEEMRTELQPLLDQVWRWCERTGVSGRTVTLKVKYADFRQITRSCTLPLPVSSRAMLERISLDLLAPLLPVRIGVRLLGVTLSALGSEQARADPQLALTL